MTEAINETKDFDYSVVLQSPYEKLMSLILRRGADHGDRTGTGRRSIVAPQLRYDLSDGTVPIPNTRKIAYKSSIKELCWFIRGSTNAQELRDMGTGFWDRWAVTEKDIDAFIDRHLNNPQFLEAMNKPIEEIRALITPQMKHQFLNQIGPMYGAMWRNAPRIAQFNSLWPEVPLSELPSDKLEIWKKEFEANKQVFESQNYTLEQHCNRSYYQTHDQLNELVRNLKVRPFSSRLVVSAWIPEFVPFEELSPTDNVIMGRGALAACHCKFQIVVSPGQDGAPNVLNMIVDIRSSDGPVGLPHNTTQYAVLQHVLAQVTDMVPGELVINLGDAHIYLNQVDTMKEQLKRDAMPFPKIKINPELKDLFQFKPDDVEITNYESHPALSYEVSV